MKETRKLMVTLTESERDERARQSTRFTRQCSAIKERKKKLAKELGDQLKEAEANRDKTAAAFESGTEERMVSCKVVIRGMQKEVFREDTGECIESTALSEEQLEEVEANSGEDVGEQPKRARVSRKKSDPAPTNLN